MQNLTRRSFFGSMIAVSSAAVLAACQSWAGDGDNDLTNGIVSEPASDPSKDNLPLSDVTPEEPTALPPAPAPPDDIVLRADLLNYGWTRFAQEMVAGFEATYPDIKVSIRTRSEWHEYPHRIAVLRAAGELGDLVETPSSTLLASWTADGMLTDLAPLMHDFAFDARDIFPGAVGAFHYQGQQTGLPFLSHGGMHLLLYDRALFDQANVEPPELTWTLAEVEGAATSLTDLAEQRYGHAIQADLPGAYPMLRAFGGELLNSWGTDCLASDPPVQDCLAWMHRQVFGLRCAPRPAAVERGTVHMWETGRLGMLRTTLREAVRLIERQPERAIGVIPWPGATTQNRPPALATGVAYCIPESSRLAPEAFQWIDYMLAPGVGASMFVRGFAEPGSRLTAWRDPEVLERFSMCEHLSPVVARARPERLPANLRTDACYQIWNRSLRQMLELETSPEETSEQIRTAMTDVLESVDRPRWEPQ